MDHLKRPFGVELTEEEEIPYVASNDYYNIPIPEYAKPTRPIRFLRICWMQGLSLPMNPSWHFSA
jgi:hypothetical protein